MMDQADRVFEAATAIRERFVDFPRVAVVLGSGMGDFVKAIEGPDPLAFALIPHFPIPSVAGHHGNLVVGSLGGVPVAALQGRFHYYEGHDLQDVTFPIRVLKRLGVQTLILTAATGGIRGDLRPGDLLTLSDHLNLIGSNPLRGPNDERFGPRFPEMSQVYSPHLRQIAAEEAGKLDIPLYEGVYAALPGPSYETPAEIRMLRTLGADVVGMSTVPEAIVARHAGIDVLAFAIVTNLASGIATTPISHEEVLEAGRTVGPQLSKLIASVVARM